MLQLAVDFADVNWLDTDVPAPAVRAQQSRDRVLRPDRFPRAQLVAELAAFSAAPNFAQQVQFSLPSWCERKTVLRQMARRAPDLLFGFFQRKCAPPARCPPAACRGPCVHSVMVDKNGVLRHSIPNDLWAVAPVVRASLRARACVLVCVDGGAAARVDRRAASRRRWPAEKSPRSSRPGREMAADRTGSTTGRMPATMPILTKA